MLTLLLLLAVLVLLINSAPVQTYLAKRTANWISSKTHTKVEVQQVSVRLLNHLLVSGLYVEDEAHDTLLYAGELTLNITDWFIFKDRPVLHEMSLKNSFAHLSRSSKGKAWNYDFLTDLFATGKSSPDDTTKVLFDLEKISLDNVRFHIDDAWTGEDIDVDIGGFGLNARTLDFTNNTLLINDLSLNNSTVLIRDYNGGKPDDTATSGEKFDSSPLNPDNWKIGLTSLRLDKCHFVLITDTVKTIKNQFDHRHIDISDIDLSITNAGLSGDTITGNLNLLHAKERCGLKVVNMKAKISVSPIAAICENLFLETNHSKMGNYYAMHYRRFPDFLEYIDSVQMVTHIRNTQVDTRDIAYFAPELWKLPALLKVSGDGKGTVANLNASKLVISDGATVLKGEIGMKGLPDIMRTKIGYSGEIFSNGLAVLRYAPWMDSSKIVDLKKVTHAYFKGDYNGWLEHFTVNGELITNLGQVNASVQMAMPGFKNKTATYWGHVSTYNAMLGTFFKQPLLGAVTAEGEISGSSFDPENAQLKMDGKFNEITIKDYIYHKISTEGTLSKKHFDGTLLVDDPNLALNFKGAFDYNEIKNVRVNATGQLLFANLKMLNLTDDTITTAADFDLDCTGNDIDNFLGYARMYNIDLKKNQHKIAIDSVYLNSTSYDNGKKSLEINSNILTAYVKGNYQLSKLPTSIQYYLSKYIPSYIKAPVNYPPDQNFEYYVKTRDIDSLWAFTVPNIRGFDNSVLRGSLNTTSKQLQLTADVPFAIINRLNFRDISVAATGNFDSLALKTAVKQIYLNDTSFGSSLSLTTTVGNDSLNFSIETATTDTTTTALINGHIQARNDSLYLTMFPSQFYLNRVKWDIPHGNIAYSKQFLQVNGLELSSGLQKIVMNSAWENNDNKLKIDIENLDIGQISNWSRLQEYQADGRVNGTLTVEKIFDELEVISDLKATNVKLGSDTVGVVNLCGSFNSVKKTLNLDPKTGIYRDGASVTAAGLIALDTASNQALDAYIECKNAKLTWASPFISGVFSKLGGIVNGGISLKGKASDPQISGDLGLLDATFKLDYMGCSYHIPNASVRVNNKSITWGKVDVYDTYGNFGVLSGGFTHNLFQNMRMRITLVSPKIEVMRLSSSENSMFYGNVIAGMDSFTVRGPFNNIRLHAYNVTPAASSHIYLPVASGGDLNTYSYVTFKSYGKAQTKVAPASSIKLDLAIDATLNDLAEITIVLDPTTGDAITCRGDGNIQLSIPPGNDMRITGLYVINRGTYDFTFQELFHRQFQLNAGSTISFTGPFFSTELDVNATYSRKARLYDLLTENELTELKNAAPAEITDAKQPQTVNILMSMKGNIVTPALSFNMELPDKRSFGTYAYTKLYRINQDERQKFDQVGSFLLINSFLPSDGLGTGSVAGNFVINNASQLFTKSASAGLTSLVSKLIGDNKLNVDLNYNTYNFNDQLSSSSYNRNQVKLGVSHPFLNDKLLVEIGSTSDWGRPVNTSANTTNFNITGDFRIQYLLKQPNGLRLNAFRTSDYDVTIDKDITRSGVGISWRKSFDNFQEFIHGAAYYRRLEGKTKPLFPPDSGKKN